MKPFDPDPFGESIDYDAFIASKTIGTTGTGFEPLPFTAPMKPFQQTATAFAIKKGQAALFEDTGLGKTRQQLEWARQVVEKTGQPVLILTKLAVCRQTVGEADAVGIAAAFIRGPEEITGPGIYVTNYEKMDALHAAGVFGGCAASLGGIVLDESSILKNFTGATSRALREWCQPIPYRLCATATPAPNDWDELGQHAEFLGVMSAAQMLATWFINDTSDTGTWRLKKHAREDFWRWVSTWAACIFKPSDVDSSPGADDGYDLPPLHINEVRFALSDRDIAGNIDDGTLIDMTVVNATNQAREAKRTLAERAVWIAKVIAWKLPSQPVCVFVETDVEADAIVAAIEAEGVTDFAEVRGSDDAEDKAANLYAFATGKLRVMVTKCRIAGFGLNLQHCAHVIFASPSYSFEQWYQAVRRFYRFGQLREVQCYMLRGENMERVAEVWRKKMEQFDAMKSEMRTAAAHLKGDSRKGMECNTEIRSKSGAGWTMYHGDCVRVAKTMPAESVDFSVFSPPFSSIFTYSNDAQDMGNCAGVNDFIAQFKFLIDELMRLTAPGRLCAVHCLDLLAAKWKDGYIGYQDFSGAIVRAFMDAGWIQWNRITIWKCPVVEMTRTKAHGLLYRTLKKDSANSRVGSAEYMLVFKKPGENAKPIVHRPQDFPLSLWQEYASPVWQTIDQSDTLNGIKGVRAARGMNDERHICPLQLGVIKRALLLWSAPGDTVFSPFAGIGSEGSESVMAGRSFIGAELKPEYFKQACKNLAAAEGEASQELPFSGWSDDNEMDAMMPAANHGGDAE